MFGLKLSCACTRGTLTVTLAFPTNLGLLKFFNRIDVSFDLHLLY